MNLFGSKGVYLTNYFLALTSSFKKEFNASIVSPVSVI